MKTEIDKKGRLIFTAETDSDFKALEMLFDINEYKYMEYDSESKSMLLDLVNNDSLICTKIKYSNIGYHRKLLVHYTEWFRKQEFDKLSSNNGLVGLYLSQCNPNNNQSDNKS